MQTADDTWPLEPAADELEDPALSGVASRPPHLVREDLPAIDEDDPSPPRESDDAVAAPDPKMPDADAADQRWTLEIRDAAARWDRLTEEDLASLNRHEASLSDLVRKRYGLTAAETALQLTGFIEDHQLFGL